ncbi:uncharacterized protein GIQ15_00361 [Arthroderma uncinatum]|uniref:uncharacterized protein n=1 Tax=Arthroderma uncinatum TaxID=74035 RepID=UPI00144A9977|nr:uncharacterized protein GIQ15_00361 [Arthroderma uncinatum]KAF3490844.1 hypothetical protein GIQ15_00361 [Arthroderma uncinatum]
MSTSNGVSRERSLVEEISQNLANTRYTFGASSIQYRTVLDMLKAYIADLEKRSAGLDGRMTGAGDSDVEDLILLLERELKV